jgi:NAD(P)H-hydrate epimerase
LLRDNRRAHKNDFGHVLVIAGSPSMLGAAALSSLAAMRAGAGLTTAAVACSLELTLQKKISNVIMTLPLPQTRKGTIALKAFDVLKDRWPKFSSVALGPGLTTAPGTAKFVEKMYQECPLPVVVDADALNALAGRIEHIDALSAPRVLTPHAGELARLTGRVTPTGAKGRKAITKEYARRWGVVLVLKGHHTVVASPAGKVYVNKTGNPGMATAGSGDVLTGMIAALLAQGVSSYEAACFGVWWHGRAGDLAAKGKKVPCRIAQDLQRYFSEAL